MQIHVWHTLQFNTQFMYKITDNTDFCLENVDTIHNQRKITKLTIIHVKNGSLVCKENNAYIYVQMFS